MQDASIVGTQVCDGSMQAVRATSSIARRSATSLAVFCSQPSFFSRMGDCLIYSDTSPFSKELVRQLQSALAQEYAQPISFKPVKELKETKGYNRHLIVFHDDAEQVRSCVEECVQRELADWHGRPVVLLGTHENAREHVIALQELLTSDRVPSEATRVVSAIIPEDVQHATDNHDSVSWALDALLAKLAPRIHLIFGTNKGTTQEFCEDLSTTLTQKGIRNVVCRADSKSPERLMRMGQPLLILLATFKRGSVTPDAAELLSWLETQSALGVPLQTVYGEPVEFAVCGFGTSSHTETFCLASKFMETALLNAGAQKILDRYCVDYASEEMFSQWVSTAVLPYLEKTLPQSYILSPSRTIVDAVTTAEDLSTGPSEGVLTPQHAATTAIPPSVHYAESLDKLVQELSPFKDQLLVQPAVFTAYCVSCVTQLCPQPCVAEGLSCVQLDLDLPEHHPGYATFDDLNILPDNAPERVQWYFDFLTKDNGVTLESHVAVLERPDGDPASLRFPLGCTVRDVLTRYCDLSLLPDRTCLEAFTPYIQEPSEQAAWKSLLSDSDFYMAHVHHARLTFSEIVLSLIPSLQLPLSEFLLRCPKQVARTYSVASSARESPRRLNCVVSLEHAELPDVDLTLFRALGFRPTSDVLTQRHYYGVASTALCCNTQPANTIWAQLQPSSMKLPFDFGVPIILIAGGSGIAPLRGLWRELLTRKREGGLIGPVHLFFGCRSSTQDWLYKDEMQQLLFKDGVSHSDVASSNSDAIFKTIACAFSRDQAEKVYIDVVLRDHRAILVEAMDQGGQIYVCGSSKFADSAMAALKDIAPTMVATWSSSGRLQVEDFG